MPASHHYYAATGRNRSVISQAKRSLGSRACRLVVMSLLASTWAVKAGSRAACPEVPRGVECTCERVGDVLLAVYPLKVDRSRKEFRDPRGLMEPKRWRELCSETVPLAVVERYTWTTGQTFTAQVKIAHYGRVEIAGAVVTWSLTDAVGNRLASGRFPARNVPQGALTEVGQICASLAKAKAPRKLRLGVRIAGTKYQNQYDLWVYPVGPQVTPPVGVTVRRSLDAGTLSLLTEGGKLLLLPDPENLEHSVEILFASDSWCYPRFGRGDPPGTLGILCDPKHPALAKFPTESHCNWQWYYLLMNSRAVILDDTPADLRPVVQVIDNLDHDRSHKLGLIFEARVGRGKVLVCTSDLLAMLDRPEARQLLSSLLAYAGSAQFNPRNELSPPSLKRALAQAPPNLALNKAATASSSESETRASSKANDGDPNTRWCAADDKTGHWWQVDLGEPRDLTGCEIRWEFDGRLYQYVVEGSTDGKAWTMVSDQRGNEQRTQVQKLTFSAKGIRHVRVTVTGLQKAPPQWASIWEIKVFGAE